jgi:hypothetical protein
MALLSTLVYPLSFMVFTPLVLAHDRYDELSKHQANTPVNSVLWVHYKSKVYIGIILV